MRLIQNVIIGIIMGVANIIPGVSGGTMVVMLGVYDKFIEELSYCINELKNLFKIKKGKGILKSIGQFFANIWKREKNFLIPIFVSLAISVYILSKIFSGMSETAQMLRNFAFVGLIIGGIPFLIKELKRAKPGKKEKINEEGKVSKIRYILPFLITLLIIVTIYILKTKGIVIPAIKLENISFMQKIIIFLIGAIAAFSMVIPGISGSMIVVILGYYELMTKSISSFNLAFIIPFAIGIIVGIIVATKIIKYLLENYYITTYSGIIGFVLGSIPMVMPNVMPITKKMWIYSAITILIGIVLSYGLEKYAQTIEK